jgi:serine-type D-Ala-D-Ala carboxypeptidase/endopeptidase
VKLSIYQPLLGSCGYEAYWMETERRLGLEATTTGCGFGCLEGNRTSKSVASVCLKWYRAQRCLECPMKDKLTASRLSELVNRVLASLNSVEFAVQSVSGSTLVRLGILALMLVFAPMATSRAADDPMLAEAADLAGTIMFLDSGAPGMVLTVVRGDQTLIRGYGEVEKGDKRTPDGTSLLRLNSITKVFTTEVLVSLVSDGKVTLTEPLQRFAGNVRVPAFGVRAITLLDLATHSAALPREMGEAPEGANPRAWPTREDRWKWLPGYQLPWAPGTITAYSNVGFDLLADALETAAGKSYPDLLRARVTEPFGMKDTTFTPTFEQCARLMIGSGLGGPASCVDTHATNGSGGLYSTANDMALWLHHNIADKDGAFALYHAIYRLRQTMPAAIGFDEASPMAGLGLGWVMMAAQGTQPMVLAKSGGGAGFMSYVAFAPGRGIGVFLAVSRVDFPMFVALADGVNKLIASLAIR